MLKKLESKEIYFAHNVYSVYVSGSDRQCTPLLGWTFKNNLFFAQVSTYRAIVMSLQTHFGQLITPSKQKPPTNNYVILILPIQIFIHSFIKKKKEVRSKIFLTAKTFIINHCFSAHKILFFASNIWKTLFNDECLLVVFS